ncbi:uncharacterized protein LOC134773274 [Penaeus indicus]|uniref:uncharacterized protein LOC134773274 n=1 Tax=Penaeus indicus TaxID=29960 RepID=UPI00300D54FB
MARTVGVRSPTTDGLGSARDKSLVWRGLNENAVEERPGNLSGTVRDHALSGKPRNFARISGNPSHTSGKPRSYTLTPWESSHLSSMPGKSKHSTKSVKCYTCGKLVEDIHFKEHLFFGESECTRCHWKISSCEAFRVNWIVQRIGSATCPHTLTYCMTPSEYISNRLSEESPHGLVTSRLTSYICSLKKLKVSKPWKNAIDQCLKFLDGETSHNATQLQKGPETKPKPAKRSKSKTHFTRVKGGAKKRIIRTPSNGYYLIARHAIEECPMCYTELCPSRFTMNISSCFLSTVCVECDLTVYIIFDPPDGSTPKISIETEHGLPEKQKNCTTKMKNKPGVKEDNAMP